MSELPEGWVTTPLQTLAAKTKYPIGDGDHGQIKPATYTDKGIPYIRVADMGWGKFEPNGLVYIPESVHEKNIKSELHPGDILIAKTGATIGKCCIIPDTIPTANTTSSVGKVTVNQDITSPQWILYYFLSREFKEQMWAVSEKTAQPGFNIADLKMFKVPLASLSEQNRIVTKLDKLLGKVDACEKRLTKIPVILKRFRQSILAAACSGRLTAEWREDDSYENDLPADWQWIPLEELLPRGGIFDGPFGSNLKSSDYTDSGVRVVRLENVGHLRFIGEKESFVSRKKYETLKKHTVGIGDIIFASFISEEIRVCLLPVLATKAIAKADCFCLRPKAEVVDRQYLTYQLVSRESYDKLVEEVHGATRPRINTTQLRKVEIRICPLPEQQEIVRRVEALFALADQIEARYTKAKAYVDKLTQSILAKAFRGELVPQDPNDEPASVLLEKIKAEREKNEKTNVRSKKTTK
ncbi:MAG: restriction endonuclease subunit S [Nitrospirae bacterium]|nr:restriction endonuclease subunit S [Nitrospirota bacterium]